MKLWISLAVFSVVLTAVIFAADYNGNGSSSSSNNTATDTTQQIPAEIKSPITENPSMVPPEIDKSQNSTMPPEYEETVTDQGLSTQIRQALQNDKQFALELNNLQISSENGRVILKGTVRTEEIRYYIVSRVSSIAGVNIVVNQIQIERE